MSRNEYGAWLPWAVVEQLVQYRLRPASRWQVFLLILATSCRYGGREARLSVTEIAERTALCERTVKAALADLMRSGLVRRQGRYRKLLVTVVPPAMTPTSPEVELTIPPC